MDVRNKSLQSWGQHQLQLHPGARVCLRGTPCVWCHWHAESLHHNLFLGRGFNNYVVRRRLIQWWGHWAWIGCDCPYCWNRHGHHLLIGGCFIGSVHPRHKEGNSSYAALFIQGRVPRLMCYRDRATISSWDRDRISHAALLCVIFCRWISSLLQSTSCLAAWSRERIIWPFPHTLQTQWRNLRCSIQCPRLSLMSLV